VQDDIAAGGGEQLAAIWSIYGCSSEARPSLTALARTAAARAFHSPSYHQLDVPHQAEQLWFGFSSAVEAAPADA
jgi:hypothetical protein